MKIATLLILALLSISSFASSVGETISRIERETNSKCERTGGSLFNFCSGSIPREGETSVPYTCRYSSKYTCYSNEKDFKIKLKVIEAYNYRTQERENRVTKVIYLD